MTKIIRLTESDLVRTIIKIINEQSNTSSFVNNLNAIIDNIEGGYYNPDWHYDNVMGRSGETLYGFDRRNAPELVNMPEGKQFWSLVDKYKNNKTWTRYYKPTGELDRQLKSLLVKIMEKHYTNLANNHFDDATKRVILSHPGLQFHFIYAAWNGPGWFKRFADSFKNRISSGMSDISQLFDSSVGDRLASYPATIKKSGNIISKLFK